MANFDLRILCVDDQEAILDLYQHSVTAAGFTPILCSNPQIASDRFKEEVSNLVMVISDFKMPEMSGFDFRRSILPEGAAVPFIIVSSYVSKEMALEALDLKIDGFFDKPIEEEGLCKLIEKYAQNRLTTIRENQILEGVFIEEATAIIDDMDTVLLALDHDRTNQEKINLVFRGAHTIKGSSGVLSTPIVTRYVHKYEDIISAVKKGQLELSDAVYEILLKGFDRIKELISSAANKTLQKFKLENLLQELELKQIHTQNVEVQKTQIAPQPAQGSLQKVKDSVTVPIEMLEQLSSCSGEITVIRNMVNKLVKSLARQYTGNKDLQNLDELLDEMHKINGTIQTYITDLRKVPIAGVLKPIPRIVRDLAKDLGKAIHLKIEGEKIRVDNALATVCSNSLVHLVRNSADHGIEDITTRKTLGKPETGNISIQCKETGDEVHIFITDDGRGIDVQKIREKALEKGLYTQLQLDEMTEQQSLSIIFASGFSTAAKVTDVSGRGVGMDMVRSSVEAVGGQILINSQPGLGSTFHLKLPVPKSVLIITSLLVEAGKCSYAIPQDSIQKVLRIEADTFQQMLQMASTGRTLRYGDEIFPLLILSEILGVESKSKDSENNAQPIEVLILESDKLRYALQVDGIQDSEEIVVKSIQTYFNPKSAFGGATFMGDGSVGLILDVKGIADLGGLSPHEVNVNAPINAEISAAQATTPRNFLLFRLGTRALFGVPLEQVFRLEEFDAAKIQHSGAERVIIYRDGVMPLYSFEKLLSLHPGSTESSLSLTKIPAIVSKGKYGFFGLQIESVVDITAAETEVSRTIRDRKGVVGNTFMREQNVTILDLETVLGQPLAS